MCTYKLLQPKYHNIDKQTIHLETKKLYIVEMLIIIFILSSIIYPLFLFFTVNLLHDSNIYQDVSVKAEYNKQ